MVITNISYNITNLSVLQYIAYKYYLKSAERGNIRGGILIADIWTTGMPGFVNRHPSDAVLSATYFFIYFNSHAFLFVS